MQILSLCERANERAMAHKMDLSRVFYGARAVVAFTFQTICRRRSYKEHLETGDELKLDMTAAVQSLEADVAAGDVCYVRILDLIHTGATELFQIMRVTNATARGICPAFAERVDESEARKWSRVVGARKGRWMDDQRWRAFAGNFRKVRTALALKPSPSARAA